MCGRYALSFRPSVARQRLVSQHMPVDDAPDDDDERLRSTYNFAPGYHGLIYRAVLPGSDQDDQNDGNDGDTNDAHLKAKEKPGTMPSDVDAHTVKHTLQTAKWGLIPFWTKRPPDYSGQLRTINCRDDSLIEDRGMWTTMKKRKRCIVIAEGFYEWLKKNDGKQKIPHFVKRVDGGLMCFAGLWDMVQYEGSEDKLYTYTIITTDSNTQLKFLHDRMPVILEPGSDALEKWLDPHNKGWSKELQDLLTPFQGNLECFPVDTAVGKVGNNSPNFVIPIDSKHNKKNIANFFDKQKDSNIKEEAGDKRETTVKIEHEESDAPLPMPAIIPGKEDVHDLKTERHDPEHAQSMPVKRKQEEAGLGDDKQSRKVSKVDDNKEESTRHVDAPVRKRRSAISNNKTAKSPSKSGSNARITQFFSGAT